VAWLGRDGDGDSVVDSHWSRAAGGKSDRSDDWRLRWKSWVENDISGVGLGDGRRGKVCGVDDRGTVVAYRSGARHESVGGRGDGRGNGDRPGRVRRNDRSRSWLVVAPLLAGSDGNGRSCQRRYNLSPIGLRYWADRLGGVGSNNLRLSRDTSRNWWMRGL